MITAKEARKYTDKRRAEINQTEIYLKDINSYIEDACCRGRNRTYYYFSMDKTDLKTVKGVIRSLKKLYGYKVITSPFMFLLNGINICIEW